MRKLSYQEIAEVAKRLADDHGAGRLMARKTFDAVKRENSFGSKDCSNGLKMKECGFDDITGDNDFLYQNPEKTARVSLNKTPETPRNSRDVRTLSFALFRKARSGNWVNDGFNIEFIDGKISKAELVSVTGPRVSELQDILAQTLASITAKAMEE